MPGRRSRTRLLGALGSMAIAACGLSIATAPAVLAVPNSVVVSSFDAGPIGVSGTLTFTPPGAAGYLNLTVGLPSSEYTTGWTTGDCASNGITVAINGTSLPVACAHGTDGALNTIVAYNYWSSPSLTATDVITMTWGASVAQRTGASSAAPFQVSTSVLAPNSYTPVTPTLAGPTPAVASVLPASGPTAGGTVMTITGTGFAGPSLGVTVGGVAATSVTMVSSTQVTATTPASFLAGAKDVVVTNGNGQQRTALGAFTYLAAPPVFTSMSPTSGPTAGGTPITITGTGFNGGSNVLVGGAACTSKVVTPPTSISCVTPAGTAGVVDVIVANMDLQVSTGIGAFTFTSSGGGSGGGGSGGGGSGGGSVDPVVTATPSASPSASPSAAPARLDPVVAEGNPHIPAGGMPAGGSVLLVGGVPVPVTVSPNSKEDPVALVFTADGVSMQLQGLGAGGDPLGLTSGQALILQTQQPGTRSGLWGGVVRSRLAALSGAGPTAVLGGSGFAPGSPVRVFILPGTYLGEVIVDASGGFSGSVPVPAGIVPGVHTLQANGFAPDLSVRSLSVGALVKPASARAVSRVSFAPLSSSLTAAGRAALDALAARAGMGTVRTLAVGYVDRTAATSNDGALSMARARSVVAYLRSIGVTGPAIARGGGVSRATGPYARQVIVAITYWD